MSGSTAAELAHFDRIACTECGGRDFHVKALADGSIAVTCVEHDSHVASQRPVAKKVWAWEMTMFRHGVLPSGTATTVTVPDGEGDRLVYVPCAADPKAPTAAEIACGVDLGLLGS